MTSALYLLYLYDDNNFDLEKANKIHHFESSLGEKT